MVAPDPSSTSLPNSQVCRSADLVHLTQLALVKLRNVHINSTFCTVATQLQLLRIESWRSIKVCLQFFAEIATRNPEKPPNNDNKNG